MIRATVTSLREYNWSSSKIHCSCCERGQLAAAAEILNVNGAQLLLLLLLPPQPQALSRLVCNLCLLAEEGSHMMKSRLRQHLLRTIFYLFAEGAFKTSFEDISSWLEWLALNLLLCWWQTHSTPYKKQGSVLPHKHILQSALFYPTMHTQTQKHTTAQTSTCHNVTHSRHHKVQSSVFYHKRKWCDSTLVQSENNITRDLTLVRRSSSPHFLCSFVQTVKHFEQSTLIGKVCSMQKPMWSF